MRTTTKTKTTKTPRRLRIFSAKCIGINYVYAHTHVFPQVFQVTSHIVEFCLVLRVINYSFFFQDDSNQHDARPPHDRCEGRRDAWTAYQLCIFFLYSQFSTTN